MRTVIAVAGALASIGLLAVSMAVNFQFGLSLGRDAVNAAIFGAASLCCDALKAALPFAIAWGLRERRYLVGATGALLFAVATIYSLASALGFAAVNRTASTGAARAEARLYADLSDETARLRSERDALGAPRPISAIDAAIRAAEQHRRWRSTASCTGATVAASIRFCERYFALQAERGSAVRLAQVNERLSALRVEIAGLSSEAVTGDADPQLTALTQLLSLSEGAVRLGLLLLVTAFVELGSGLGLFVSLAHMRRARSLLDPARASPERDASPAPSLEASDAAWAAARLVAQTGASAAVTELFSDYQAWGAARGRRDGLGPVALAGWLEAQGYRRARIDGR